MAPIVFPSWQWICVSVCKDLMYFQRPVAFGLKTFKISFSKENACFPAVDPSHAYFVMSPPAVGRHLRIFPK